MWSLTTKSGKIKYIERCAPGCPQDYVTVTFDRDTAQNRKKAQAILNERIAVLMEAVAPSGTLKTVLADYQAYQRQHTRPSTYTRNERVLDAVVKLLGEDTLMNDLTAGYIKDRLPNGSPTLYNQRLVRLKAFLRWSYENDRIESVAFLAKLKPLPTDYKEKLAEKYLEKDELRTLLDGMQVDKWKTVTEFLALTGMRIGEMLALAPADVADRSIRINKTYIYQLGKVSPFTKTESSTREIYIQEELLPVVEKIRKTYSTRQSFFFFQYDAYRKYLSENSERLLGRKITPHTLRHTMTSLMAGEGVPLEVISRRLGHSDDSEITKRVYFHVVEGLKDRDARLLERVKIL